MWHPSDRLFAANPHVAAEESRPEWADDEFTAKNGDKYYTVTEPKAVTMRTPSGQMAGYVNWGDNGVIGNMRVREEHQRRGIGERPHQAALESPDFTFSHEEQQTGGTKHPVRVDLHAHHPDSSEPVGTLTYFPPKRRGGPLTVDNLRVDVPGAGSALLNEMEARHPGSRTHFPYAVKRNNNNPDVTGHGAGNAGNPSDWDTHYSNLAPEVHRGLALHVPPASGSIINSSAPTESHLAELHIHLANLPMGTHWTENERSAQQFAHNAVSDYRTHIPVVIHAQTPQRKDIETRRDQLYRGGVFPYGDPHSPENEVPVRKGRSVAVTGISWRPDAPHPEADENGWLHHTYDEPMRYTALKDVNESDRNPSGEKPLTSDLPEQQYEGDGGPPPCPYCGYPEFTELPGNGRADRAQCVQCGGVIFSVNGNQWQPELIGDPSNHPSSAPDPASGGVGGAANSQVLMNQGPVRTHDDSQLRTSLSSLGSSASAPFSLWHESKVRNEDGWTYDPDSYYGRTHITGPHGQDTYLYTEGMGIKQVRHPEHMPTPLYHGTPRDIPEGDDIEPGHPGNFVRRMKHVYMTEIPEEAAKYAGPQGHVYQVQPTDYYGHRSDARGTNWATESPVKIVREVPFEWPRGEGPQFTALLKLADDDQCPRCSGDMTDMAPDVCLDCGYTQPMRVSDSVQHGAARRDTYFDPHFFDAMLEFGWNHDKGEQHPSRLETTTPTKRVGFQGYVEGEQATHTNPHRPDIWPDWEDEQPVGYHGGVHFFRNVSGRLNNYAAWRKHGEVLRVPLREGNLYATQGIVRDHGVAQYLKDPHSNWKIRARPGYPGYDHPLFVHHEGNYYTLDGHHRTAAALVRGDSHILGNVYDADKHGFPEPPQDPDFHSYYDPQGVLTKYSVTLADCPFIFSDPQEKLDHEVRHHDDGFCLAKRMSRTVSPSDETDTYEDAEHTAAFDPHFSLWHEAAADWAEPELIPEQEAARNADWRDYKRENLNLAKNPPAGTHIWRGEVRHENDLERPPSVGMHWTVSPDQVVLSRDVPSQHHRVLWQGVLDDPEQQTIPRTHPIWQGRHQSMDSEAEVRLRPGASIRLNRRYVDNNNEGMAYPNNPAASHESWTAHDMDHVVPVEHHRRENDGMMQYQDAYPDLFQEGAPHTAGFWDTWHRHDFTEPQSHTAVLNDEVPWCAHLYHGNCTYPGDKLPDGTVLGIPQDRGPCPWKHSAFQQAACPISEPGPMAVMTVTAANEPTQLDLPAAHAQMKQDYQRYMNREFDHSYRDPAHQYLEIGEHLRSRGIDAQFNGMDANTARYADTMLSHLHDKYPGVLHEVSSAPDIPLSDEMAHTSGGSITYSERAAQRPGQLETHANANHGSGHLSAPGALGVHAHEFGHALTHYVGLGDLNLHGMAKELHPRAATPARAYELAKKKISDYAAKGGPDELTAEAFADYALHGENAAPFSQAIAHKMTQVYELKRATEGMHFRPSVQDFGQQHTVVAYDSDGNQIGNITHDVRDNSTQRFIQPDYKESALGKRLEHELSKSIQWRKHGMLVETVPEEFVDQSFSLWHLANGPEQDYRTQHQAPDSDYGAPAHDVEQMMPDYYTHPEYDARRGMGSDVAPHHHVPGQPELPRRADSYHPSVIFPPESLYSEHDTRTAALDKEGSWHLTATWADVRAKAKAIRASGGVRIAVASMDGVGGEVQGDHHIYETLLTFVPGSTKVGSWQCGCKWAAYAWGRSPMYRRFEGRMCSHALAMQYEAQARGMFGREVKEDHKRPTWLKPHSPIVVQYERPSDKHPQGIDLTRRAVPPGNMRSTWGSHTSALQHEPVLRNPHTKGDEWFHGTRAYPEELSQGGFQDPMAASEEAYELPDSEPSGHWNALLGTHFTTDHEVAKQFAKGEHESGQNSRMDESDRPVYEGVTHARLHLNNPKVYESEHDIDHDAYEHEHGLGNHPSEHIPEMDSDDEYDREDAQESWPNAYRLHETYGHGQIPRDDYTPLGEPGHGHPERTLWLNTHPDRHGIASRFRERLQKQGHDGIIYGNEYEKSVHGKNAVSAIAFDPHRVEITHYHAVDANEVNPRQRAFERERMPGYGQEHLPGMEASMTADPVVAIESLKALGMSHIEAQRIVRQAVTKHDVAPRSKTASRHCPECGASVSSGVARCPECGANLADVPELHEAAVDRFDPPVVGEFGEPGSGITLHDDLGHPHDPSHWADSHWSAGERYELDPDHPLHTTQEGYWPFSFHEDDPEGTSGSYYLHHPVDYSSVGNDYDLPMVARVNGKDWIGHGHHRLMADRINGRPTTVLYTDFDAHRTASWSGEEQRCPHCGGYLGPAAFKQGRCPHCGHALAHKEGASQGLNNTQDARMSTEAPKWNAGDLAVCDQCGGQGCGHCGGTGQVITTLGGTGSPMPDQNPEAGKVMREDGLAWGDPLQMGAAKHNSGPSVAGVVLKAGDTGRVLMLQRDNSDENDPAAGRWEFPGGHIDPGDHTSLHGAMREFEEEIGQPFPTGGTVHHVWTSPNGVYQGHVVVIPSEDGVLTQDGRVHTNPDDPHGDHPEQAAWWEVEHARRNPALREEVKKGTPWRQIVQAGEPIEKTAAQNEPVLGNLPDNHEYVRENPQNFAYHGNGYRLHHDPITAFAGNTVTAHVKTRNGRYKQIGYLSWFGGENRNDGSNVDGGVIHKVFVDPEHQRQGVASAMLDFGRTKRPDLRHSQALSEDGRAWSEHVGIAGQSDIEYRHTPMQGNVYPYISAHHNGQEIGRLTWSQGMAYPFDQTNGEIQDVHVHPDYGRQGIATEMYRRAQGIDPQVRHSDNLTDAGSEFVDSFRHQADYAANDPFSGNGPEVHTPIDPPLHSNSTNPASTGYATGWDPVGWNGEQPFSGRDDVPMAAYEAALTPVIEARQSYQPPQSVGTVLGEWGQGRTPVVFDRAARTLATLHDEPEPALPFTDGADAPGIDPASRYSANPFDPYYGDSNDTGQDSIRDIEDSLSPSSVTAAGHSTADHASVADIVAQFQATAAAGALMSSGAAAPSNDGMNIAAAAQAHLRKSALRDFSWQEQQDLINEGARDRTRARNMNDLRIEGTHYEQLDQQRDPDNDYDDLFV